MKKLLFTLIVLGSLNGYGQIFEQNFESSDSKTDYVGNGTGQFDWVSSFGNSPSTIETESGNNFLRFDKKGGSSSNITRRTNLNADPSKSVAVVKFKLRVSPPDIEQTSPPNDLAALYLGSVSPATTAFNNDDVSVVPDANTFSTLLLRVQKVNASQYQFFISSTTFYFEGWQDILYIANKSGTDINYKNPLGDNTSLATGKQDIWVGTTKVISAGTISTNYTQSSFNQFKIRVPSGYANVKIDIDDIKIYDSVSVLPVTFTSFTAKQSGTTSLLKWTTASEQENSRFEILRSTGENDFGVIGTVKGSGTTTVESNYTFTDFNPSLGSNYYKIRQIDIDGRQTEYPVVSHVLIEKNNSLIQVISDERAGYITIGIDSDRNQTESLSITDVNGRILYQRQIHLQSGKNSIQIPYNFQPGMYVLNLASKKLTTKFIK
ncbi:T9SS type A sorting domain-containing protein [Pseudopedobacter sp.]|uniref:T9SS type A sorting domain-containing protein n=1 Tax=Pseudopedobacter sp. TaxID=1936787 RepID=UPI00334208F5